MGKFLRGVVITTVAAVWLLILAGAIVWVGGVPSAADPGVAANVPETTKSRAPHLLDPPTPAPDPEPVMPSLDPRPEPPEPTLLDILLGGDGDARGDPDDSHNPDEEGGDEDGYEWPEAQNGKRKHDRGED